MVSVKKDKLGSLSRDPCTVEGGRSMQRNERGLWSLPDPDLSSGSASDRFGRRLCLFSRLCSGHRQADRRVHQDYACDAVNTELETVLNINVSCGLYTGL